MNRFFVKPENVGPDRIFIEDREDLHHMIKVLRLGVGDEIEISDSVQWEYRARLDSLDTEGAEAVILDKQKFSAEPCVQVTLFQGIPKQGKMELIVQKAVELGVTAIVPVFMARTVVVDRGKFHKKVQRWQKVSAEAVKQCKRGIIPQVEDPMKLPQVIDVFGDYDLVLFPYENESGTTIKDVLCSERQRWSKEIAETEIQADKQESLGFSKKIAVLIGPEGGFSDEEAEKIQAAGGRSVSLGKATLRTETAGMAALSMIQYELEL